MNINDFKILVKENTNKSKLKLKEYLNSIDKYKHKLSFASVKRRHMLL